MYFPIMQDKRRLLVYVCLRLFLIASVVSQACFQPVKAGSDSVNESSIDRLTNTILLKEIALERYYLKYKIIANKEPKFRRLRYFLGQQSSLGLFLAGDIVAINQSGKHLQTPLEISEGNLKGSVKIELIGSILGGASSVTELCSNSYIAMKNKMHGQDPASARTNVKAMLREINALIGQREKLVSHERSNPAYSIYSTEGELLSYYRDWCIYEFAKIYADVKSYQSSENVYYFLSTAAYSLYSVAGYLAVRSFSRPQFGSSSIITGMVGDSIFVLSAPASYLARKLLYKYNNNASYRHLGEQSYDVEKASADVLIRLHEKVAYAESGALVNAGTIKRRLNAYDLWDQRYDEYMNKELEQLRRYDKIALQSLFFGPIISGSFLAEDLLGAVAFYGNNRRPKTANNLAFAGFVTAGAGSAVGLAATTWYYLDESLNQHKLRLHGDLPEQLLQKRLKALDEIAAMIEP